MSGLKMGLVLDLNLVLALLDRQKMLLIKNLILNALIVKKMCHPFIKPVKFVVSSSIIPAIVSELE
jgi:hypothetical protein